MNVAELELTPPRNRSGSQYIIFYFLESESKPQLVAYSRTIVPLRHDCPRYLRRVQFNRQSDPPIDLKIPQSGDAPTTYNPLICIHLMYL